MKQLRDAWLALALVAALLGCKQLSKAEPGAGSASAASSPAPAPSATAPAASASAEPAETTCGKAVACCKLVADKAGYKKQDNKCEQFEKYSEARCKAELGQLRQAARLIGLDCDKPK